MLTKEEAWWWYQQGCRDGLGTWDHKIIDHKFRFEEHWTKEKAPPSFEGEPRSDDDYPCY